MALKILDTVEVIETMENYLTVIRPKPDIRPMLDISYEIKGQSVILNEIRPFWDNPSEIMTIPYAKATYTKAKNVWKIYWMRANLKWYPYGPRLTVKSLSDFLKIVDEDECGCFKG